MKNRKLNTQKYERWTLEGTFNKHCDKCMDTAVCRLEATSHVGLMQA